jgi:DNA-binding transcriptional LysR family regulator
MDYLQMLYAVTMADSASMTEAAEKLCLSQSTLSLSYRKLENELGVSLFRREGRGLFLTPEGKIFCAEARSILAQVDGLKNRMKSLGQEQHRTIVLCTEAMDFSNEAICVFCAAYPDTIFRQLHVSSQEIMDMLRCGKVKFAVTLDDHTDDNLKSTLLLDEPMYIMGPASSEIAGRTSISMKDLAGFPLVTQTDGYGISRLIRRFYELADIRPGAIREVREQENIGIQVINGYGVGFIPESVARSEVPNAIFRAVHNVPIPVTDSFCRRKVWLTAVRKNEPTPLTDGFLDFLKNFGRFASEKRRFPTAEEVTVAGNYVLKI